MTLEDKKDFKPTDKCWICNKSFTKGDNKVRDFIIM